MTVWLNWIRRTLGMGEHPPATSAETSVLFILNSSRKATLAELSVRSHVPEDELRPVVERMAQRGDILWDWAGPINREYKVYSRKEKV